MAHACNVLFELLDVSSLSSVFCWPAGERMYGLSGERATEDDTSASVVTETDTSLQNSTTLPTIDEDNNTTATTGKAGISQCFKFDLFRCWAVMPL